MQIVEGGIRRWLLSFQPMTAMSCALRRAAGALVSASLACSSSPARLLACSLIRSRFGGPSGCARTRR